MKYVVIASTLTGNLGGASMLEASIQTISAKDSKAQFFVYSVYPRQDRMANTYENVQILNGKPLVLALLINPLALLYKILPPLRTVLRRSRLLKPLVEADVLLDQGGVTFVKGRTIFLIYNVATILPALLVGTPVVKCSQALGDFTGTVNRLFAKLFLPRMRHIFARGKMTYSYLQKLKLANISEAADYAFLLDISEENRQATARVYKSLVITRTGRTVCIVPSKVVKKKYDKMGNDYIQLWQDYIHQLINEGYDVMLLPHSTRFDTEKTHNNDLPVCRAIAAGIESHRFHFVQDRLNAQQVRALIGRTDVLITSRFHGMVSGLAMGVPTLVVGWSHKYQEVMDQFGLAGHALSTKDLSLERLSVEFTSLVKHKKLIRKQILSKLPDVVSSAAMQVDEILRIAKG